MVNRLIKLALLLLLLAPSISDGAMVSIYQYAVLGATTNMLGSATSAETLSAFTTWQPPTYLGWIFAHWEIVNSQPISNREENGKAKDRASFTVYEDSYVYAIYLPADCDTDQDGVADGYEDYWYGHLNWNADSDTDGDLYSLSEELADGTSPIATESHPIRWADSVVTGAVVCATSATVGFDFRDYVTYTIRSDPESALFETKSVSVVSNSSVTTASYNPNGSTFAYWKLNGIPQRNSDGTAKSGFTFVAASNGIEIVAVSEADVNRRQALWWYGDADVGMESDLDDDKYTFAEELADGTSPIDSSSHPIRWTDTFVTGAVVCASGALTGFDFRGYATYTLRSEPDGALFETKQISVVTNTTVTTPSYSPNNSTFAYWRLNGVEQRNANGTAKNSFSFVASNGIEVVAVCESDPDARQKLWWYGDTSIAMDSDTDGDMYTFAEELADGTSPIDGASRPIRWTDAIVTGAVVYASSANISYNFQFHEQPTGVVLDDQYVELFTSSYAENGASSRTFAGGTQIWPVVADINGDGLWDLIVCSASATNVFVNVGSHGNPQFRESEELGMRNEEWWRATISMNSTAKLAALSLDIAPTAALSATTNGNTLLVSDADGRIWYYTSQTSQPLNPLNFSLQHKVWGGSYAGFANGLRLAAVDWDDDGDLDCLCGTAEGKLMLLRDPKVGRPTNLKADAGVDNVLLTWDPNVQSRVRGYKVYRAVGESTEYGVRGAPALPLYRDTGLAPATYAYKVSALSRFYTAGNSTPTVTESVSTEPVTATVGGPIITIGDPVKMPDGTVQIVVSINNSMNYQAAGTSIAVPYDAANLAYQKTLPSGISEKLVYKTTTASGVATIAITSGEVAPGSGTFFTLVFHGLSDGVLMGDLDGDGDVDEDDLRILIRASSLSGRKYTDYQLKAGDFNHNGKLDKGDVQSLRELLKRGNGLTSGGKE